MRTLGTALKQRRKDLGITQEQAAEDYFGVERQAYSVWERGARASLNAEFLGQLAEFLGTDNEGALIAIGWLRGGEDTGNVAEPSPRPPKSHIHATLTPVTDLTVARRRRKPEQKPAMLEATG